MVVRLWVSPLLPVAPDTINNHVKTCREEQKNLHFFAPEYGGKASQFSLPSPCSPGFPPYNLRHRGNITNFQSFSSGIQKVFKRYFCHSLPPSFDSPEPSLFSLEVTNVTTAVDIYSFGMCALEVRKPQAVVMERDQIRRQKGEMEG